MSERDWTLDYETKQRRKAELCDRMAEALRFWVLGEGRGLQDSRALLAEYDRLRDAEKEGKP